MGEGGDASKCEEHMYPLYKPGQRAASWSSAKAREIIPTLGAQLAVYTPFLDTKTRYTEIIPSSDPSGYFVNKTEVQRAKYRLQF